MVLRMSHSTTRAPLLGPGDARWRRRRLCDGDRLEYFHGVVTFLVKSATGIPLLVM